MPEPGCGDREQGLRRRLRYQGHGVDDPGYDQLQGTAAPTLQQHPSWGYPAAIAAILASAIALVVIFRRNNWL